MARPKTLKAEPVSQGTLALLERMRSAVSRAGYIDPATGEIIGENFHPLELLAAFSANPRLTYDQRIACAKECARYVEPTLKALEVKGDPEKPIRIQISDMTGAPGRVIVGYQNGFAVYEDGGSAADAVPVSNHKYDDQGYLLLEDGRRARPDREDDEN